RRPPHLHGAPRNGQHAEPLRRVREDDHVGFPELPERETGQGGRQARRSASLVRRCRYRAAHGRQGSDRHAAERQPGGGAGEGGIPGSGRGSDCRRSAAREAGDHLEQRRHGVSIGRRSRGRARRLYRPHHCDAEVSDLAARLRPTYGITVNSARGKFITLEGGEGAGKSTQINLLATWLRERDIDVVQTREPGGAPGAERIRELLVKGDVDRWTPIAETLLHYAARADHLDRTIRPALAAGRWVICDRFADSTGAYQGYGHGVPFDVIDSLFKAVVGD